MTTSCSVYSTWWSSLKATWKLITITYNKSNTALIENYMSSVPIFLWLKCRHLKVTKVVSCCIIYSLTTKSMMTSTGDQIIAKLIELRFKNHMPDTRP